MTVCVWRVQLMEEEVPMDEEQLSPELCDFVRRCMAKDPWKRPSCEQLLQHPFITKVCPGAWLGPLPWQEWFALSA